MSKPVVIFTHTHWDRAWYAGFEVFRHKLVQHLDEVLAVLESRPDYRHYTLDGQTAPLDDYLEIRPENRERFAAQARAGRLELGPWYVQPDFFIPSGEALVRNLLLGKRHCAALGSYMRVGYAPDSFGFPSQVPTILAGFGIDSFVFSRGVTPEVDRLGCDFRWLGEGTASILCTWMPQGYGHGCGLGYLAWWGDPRRQDFHPEHGVERIRDNIRIQGKYSKTGVTIVPSGVDHCPIEPRLATVVAKANETLSGYAVRHAKLREYVDEVLGSGVALGEYRGEQVSAAKGMTLQGVHSARLYLKQQNQRAQMLLERWAEPLAGLARRLAGGPDEDATIRHAWKLLLQNHPHDDICGCSVDAVHRENEVRFAAVSDIARAVRREAILRLSHRIDFTAQEGIPLVVVNPHGFPLRGPVPVEVGLDRHEVPRDPLRIVDGAGREAAFAIAGWRDDMDCWVRGVFHRRMVADLLLGVDLPAFGWATYYVQLGVKPTAVQARVRAAERQLENEHYRIVFNADGSFDLTVTESGRVHRGLLIFEDEGDRGDEYDFSPMSDAPVDSRGGKADIRCQADAVTATATVRIELDLPIAAGEDRSRRSAERLRQALTTTVRLSAGSRRIDITTEFENRARDHRLRVRFPIGLAGDRHHVEQHFSVIERRDREPGGEGWAETPTRNQKSFVSLDDGKDGLTIANRGLTEYEVLPDRTVALTLVRAVGFLSRPDLSTRKGDAGPSMPTPDAQCQRALRCEYALIAHRGDWRTSGAWREAQAFAAPPWSFRGDEVLETDSRHFDDAALSAAITFDAPPRGGELRDRLSLLSVDRDGIVLSALKPAEKGSGLIVRFYSIAGSDLGATVTVGFPAKRVIAVNLAEEEQREVPLRDGRFGFAIAHGDVASFLIE